MARSHRTIRTITLNPALDLAVSLEGLTLGQSNRAEHDALDPGGKGINVSRVIRRLQRPTLALGLTAGITGAYLRRQLEWEQVPCALEEVEGLTRINIMIYERASGRRTRLYLPGAPATDMAIFKIYGHLERVQRGDVVVLAGSLPPELADSAYADLIALLQLRGARTVVDTSGRALELALAARPTLIKPNVEETQALLGRTLDSDDAVLKAARTLLELGAEYAIISQGADGAIGAGPGGIAFKAIAPHVDAQSTVGSGDSMLAGLALMLSENRPFIAGLRLGSACGAATAATPGTTLCSRAAVLSLLRKVKVTPLAPVALAK